MKFVDRESRYPGRYKLVTADGEVLYVTLTRDDEPTKEGTFMNAETFNTLIGELQSPVLDATVV